MSVSVGFMFIVVAISTVAAIGLFVILVQHRKLPGISTDNSRLDLRWFWITVIFVVFLWISSQILIKINFGAADGAGEFGDQFGAVNALFSGLGFAGLVFTMLLQHKEIRNNQITANKQNDTMVLQQFESTFFGLIEQNRRILADIKVKKKYVTKDKKNKEVVSGLVAVGAINYWVLNSYKLALAGTSDEYELKRKVLSDVWDKVYYDLVGAVAHYFINTYHIVKFVDGYNGFDMLSARNSDRDLKIINLKRKYVSLFRSMLSHSEMCVLWYNSLGVRGVAFRPYLHNYLLLLNLDLTKGIAGKNYLMDTHPYLRFEYWRTKQKEYAAAFDDDIFLGYYKRAFDLREEELFERHEQTPRSYKQVWYLPEYYEKVRVNGNAIITKASIIRLKESMVMIDTQENDTYN